MQDRVLDSRYRLERQLGQGGMGTVWEALDLRLERRVAVKVVGASVVASDPRGRERFEREAKLLAGLSSPYIVTVHDVGEAWFGGHSVLYLVMELLPGRSVDEVLAAELPGLGEVARWGEQVCRALAVAHDSGVVHRDLKPANVMVQPDGMARVLDFGIAAVLAESSDHARLTSTGVVLGTPAYMSPEQIEGGVVDARSDLYSVGCLLYALATGRPPFSGNSLYQLLRQQMERDAAPPSELRPGLPAEWDELITALLAKSPERRPGGAAEVAERLRELSWRAPELPAGGPPPEAGEGAGGYQPTRVDPRAVLLGTCPRAGGGRLPLATGQLMRLADVQPGVRTFTVGLDWAHPAEDAEAGEPVAPAEPGEPGAAGGLRPPPEVDASALVLDAAGTVLSDEHFVFYNNLHPGDASVRLTSAAPEEDGQVREARITVDLPALDERAERVLFALSIHDAETHAHDLSEVRALHLRMLSADGEAELLCYGFPRGPAHCTGLTMGELTRDAEGWAFHAISRGYGGGLAEIASSHGVRLSAEEDAGASA